MALKFLNKKGWHTGSLRNIENVWKAEQKHEAEQKKLEELRKQIVEERERSEFRLLQEQAGLVPKQERLEFLYDSGLAVGKGSSSSGGFKALETSLPPPTKAADDSSSSKLQQPGALFEEKQQSSNDAWRKLHSDPLLLIRQREQEAISRVKNNPVQMDMIRKSVEATKSKKKMHDEDAPRRKHHHKKKHDKESSSKYQSDSDNYTSKERRNPSGTSNTRPSSEDELSGGDAGRRSSSHKRDKYRERRSSKHHSDSDNYASKEGRKSSNQRPSSEDELSSGDAERRSSSHKSYKYKEGRSSALPEPTTKKNVEVKDSRYKGRDEGARSESGEQKGRQISEDDKFDGGRRLPVIRETKALNMHRKRNPVKLSEEERSARLREMQMDAEIHEEQRWKRLKKAEERDVAEEATQGKGRNFLDDVHKSVYGTAKGGSSTVEESVRRRTHYSQGRSEAGEGNAFRR